MGNGSIWRKWDLHVHTSASFHWDGGKKLRNMSPAEVEIDMQKLYDTLKESDVAVFCLMDYWTFDGYLQFRKFLNDKGFETPKTIFPGMELRVEAPVDYRLNIHVILSNNLTRQQLIDFQSTLRIRSIGRTISDEAICEFARTLDTSKARVHGFGDPNNLNKDQLLLLGASTIEITKDSLEKAMETIPRGSGFILLPYDTTDGLKDLDWETQPHADNYFMQTSNIFESRDDETIKLFLGIETEKNKHFLCNFQKTLGMPKPVICGSDAHRYSDYGKFPNDKNTWIKADPTFEGFKQIIFEPRQRVKIHKNVPDEKTPYLVIDKVRFLDKTQKKRFSSNWLELNPNLNVIIGGKSSGKSLLLYHIAKVIAPQLVEESTKELTGNKYQFGSMEEFDFEVLWKDCYLNSLFEQEEKKTRKISYIPQMYINQLAEKQGKKNLIELINSILEQNESYKEFIDSIKQNIYEYELLINQDIKTLLCFREELRNKIVEMRSVGDKKAIIQEIKRLNEQIEKLRKESDFKDEENTQYDKLSKRLFYYSKKKERYEYVHENLNNFAVDLYQLKDSVISTVRKKALDYSYDTLTGRYLSNVAEGSTQKLINNFDVIITDVNEKLSSIDQRTSSYEMIIKSINVELEPYKEKIKNQELLNNLSKSLSEQSGKLNLIEKYEKEVSLIIEKRQNTRGQLFNNYKLLCDQYLEIDHELKKEEYFRIADNIELESYMVFDIDMFSESFINLFDRRNNLSVLFGKCFNDKNEFIFDIATHFTSIEDIFEVLSTGEKIETKFRAGVNQNFALEKLFGNYFRIEYNIKHKGDDILKMSPGKRGLVLLQLILHISNAIYPILIDQPEDNLDNRTIYYELKEFIKEKKVQRQIILVTHNANLVVSTDAENIIVSNQSGQHIGKDNKESQFEYVVGALENTFTNTAEQGILYQYGIREHVCDILEGGQEAFIKREQKYGFK